MLNKAAALALLDRAMQEEIGISFTTDSPKYAVNIVTAVRKEAEPVYSGLIIFWPAALPDAERNEIWILKKETELP